MTRNGMVAIPNEADWRKCFSEPIRIASNDLTEYIDLKRIVAGMKQEMRAYLAGGGTVERYLAELAKRQKLEIAYRERAEEKLNEMLNNQDSPPQAIKQSGNQAIKQSNNDLRAAYAYWLKANAQLKAMGIYELPLPDVLRRHQISLDLDE